MNVSLQALVVLAFVAAAGAANAQSIPVHSGLPEPYVGPHSPVIVVQRTNPIYLDHIKRLRAEALVQRSQDGGRLTQAHAEALQVRLTALDRAYGYPR